MNSIKNVWRNLFILLLSTMAFQASADATTDFIDKASAKGVAAIAAGEIALEKSTSQEVKAYAQKMINEYTSINKNLIDLAQSKKLNLANKDELIDKAKARTVKEQDNNNFDVAYARNQIVAHQQTIALFQTASSFKDYDTRNLATGILPKLQQHLLMAEQLLATTAETRTDIYQDRENQIDVDNGEGNQRIPTTDKNYE